MKTLNKLAAAGVAGLMALGVSTAFADDGRGHGRPDRDGGPSVSLTIGVADYDRGRHDGRRNGYRGRDARVVHREIYDTRHRARIVLTEEVVRTRRGPQLVCTVSARGPQARYVSDRRLHRIAHRECSPRARVRVFS